MVVYLVLLIWWAVLLAGCGYCLLDCVLSMCFGWLVWVLIVVWRVAVWLYLFERLGLGVYCWSVMFGFFCLVCVLICVVFACYVCLLRLVLRLLVVGFAHLMFRICCFGLLFCWFVGRFGLFVCFIMHCGLLCDY